MERSRFRGSPQALRLVAGLWFVIAVAWLALAVADDHAAPRIAHVVLGVAGLGLSVFRFRSGRRVLDARRAQGGPGSPDRHGAR